MKILRQNRHLDNEKGQALLESIPLLGIFVLFFGYGLGLFGVIHTGILYSVAARTYAFETFRNRANVNIFREDPSFSNGNALYYRPIGFRYHLVRPENPTSSDVQATARPIAMGLNREPVGNSQNHHNNNVVPNITRGERYLGEGVHPAWIMVGYGLCITAQCGAE